MATSCVSLLSTTENLQTQGITGPADRCTEDTYTFRRMRRWKVRRTLWYTNNQIDSWPYKKVLAIDTWLVKSYRCLDKLYTHRSK